MWRFQQCCNCLFFFNLTFTYIKGILKKKISFIQFHQFIFEQFIKFAVQLIFQMNNCFANNEFSLVFCKVVNFQGYYWRDNKPTYGLKFSVNIQVSLRDEITKFALASLYVPLLCRRCSVWYTWLRFGMENKFHSFCFICMNSWVFFWTKEVRTYQNNDL